MCNVLGGLVRDVNNVVK